MYKYELTNFMSNDFKILRDEAFVLKGGTIYLMLLKDFDNFGVEVVNRKNTFGRKTTKDRKEAEAMFDELAIRLSEFKKISDAETFIKTCFDINSLEKFKFATMALDKIITQKDIVSMTEKINFRTLLRFNYNKKKKEDGALTVYLYIKGEKKAFGLLVGTTKADDLKFEFI